MRVDLPHAFVPNNKIIGSKNNTYQKNKQVKHNNILCAAAVIDRKGERIIREYKGTEREIMEGLTRLVRDEDPDFITGYNIDNFDLPRMEERSIENSPNSLPDQAAMFGWGRLPATSNELGTRKYPGRIFPKRQNNRVWRIPGRIPLDAWWQARQTLSPQRESLKYVSNLLWPDQDDKQKLDVDASQMDMEWANRPDEVMEYCVRDTILPLDILDKLPLDSSTLSGVKFNSFINLLASLSDWALRWPFFFKPFISSAE